jgi:Uma2 family endonuclease
LIQQQPPPPRTAEDAKGAEKNNFAERLRDAPLTCNIDDGIVFFGRSAPTMPAPRLSADEYFRTPETVLPQELVYGIVRDAPAPTPGHQWLVGQVFMALAEHVRMHEAGSVWLSPIDVVLDRQQPLVVQPDIVFVARGRLHIVSDRVWGAPDLVVEVLSPRPRIGSLHERLEWFGHYGVRECWLVHQAIEEIEVVQFARGEFESRRFFVGDETVRSTVLTEFDRSVASILK